MHFNDRIVQSGLLKGEFTLEDGEVFFAFWSEKLKLERKVQDQNVSPG